MKDMMSRKVKYQFILYGYTTTSLTIITPLNVCWLLLKNLGVKIKLDVSAFWWMEWVWNLIWFLTHYCLLTEQHVDWREMKGVFSYTRNYFAISVSPSIFHYDQTVGNKKCLWSHDWKDGVWRRKEEKKKRKKRVRCQQMWDVLFK